MTSVVWNAKNCNDFSTYSGIFDSNNITSFTFGNNVERIPACLCYNMSNLTSITISNSVTEIGGHAFAGCSGLTSVTIGNSITEIEEFAFNSCYGLTSVVWNAKNCNDFSNSDIFSNNITSFTFGNNVERIPAYLCRGMSNLTSIKIPNSVTEIGDYALRGFSG